MSLSPYTPQVAVQSKVKSFWQRPEGKFGMVMAVVLGLAALYFVMPFLLTLLTDTIHLAILVGIIVAIGWFFFTDNQPKRILVNLYKVACRWCLGWIIEMDPIAILRNKMADMKKSLAKMDELVGQFRGSWQKITGVIQKNQAEVNQYLGRANQADKLAASARDPLEKQRLILEKGTDAGHAARLQQVNQRLQATANKLDGVYQKLCRWQTAAKASQQDTEFRIKEMIMEKEAMDQASGVISLFKKMFQGADVDAELYDGAMEYVENSINSQMGMIDDFNRSIEGVLTNMDLDNGIVQDEGLKMLESYQNKIVNSASGVPMLAAPQRDTIPAQINVTPVEQVPVGTQSSDKKSYF